MEDSLKGMDSLTKACPELDLFQKTKSPEYEPKRPASPGRPSPYYSKFDSARQNRARFSSPQPSVVSLVGLRSNLVAQTEVESEMLNIKEAIQVACSVLLLHYIVPVSVQTSAATNYLVLSDIKQPEKIFFPDSRTLK